MSVEISQYKPLEIPTPKVVVADYIELNGVDINDPWTYKQVGQIPFPYPETPYPNWRAHHALIYWGVDKWNRFWGNWAKSPNGIDPKEDYHLEQQATQIFEATYRDTDYSGDTEAGVKRYVKETALALKGFLHTPLLQPICLSILPDTMCFACQSTAHGRVGNHCKEIIVGDIAEVHTVMEVFDTNNAQDAYKPFLVSPEGVVLGIVITKHNLHVYAGKELPGNS